jgi:hypothetical protein
MAASSADWRSLDGAGIRSRIADPFSVGGLLVVFGVVVTLGTTREAVLAAALLAVAIFLPPTLAFVAGQLALASAVTLADGVAVALAQLALLVVLTEPARGRSVPLALGGTLVAYAALLGVVAVGLREGLLAAAGLLCLAVAVGTYLAHRVTLVRLGQVDAEAKE